MNNILSFTRKKISANTQIKQLKKEFERDEATAKYYDDGNRMIDVSKTRENVILIESPADIDKYRKNEIEKLNELRAVRSDVVDLSKITDENERKTAERKNRSATKKLMKNTADVYMGVVQPSPEFMEGLDREQQTQFFKDCLDVIQADKETFGENIISAVIHYDENSPHMQFVGSALSFEKLKANAKDLFGNKTKMSNDQTKFVEAVKAKGWDVDRGLKRVDNPDYQNFKDEFKARGVTVKAGQDHELYEEFLQSRSRLQKAEKKEKENVQRSEELDKQEVELAMRGADIARREEELQEAEERLKLEYAEKANILASKQQEIRLREEYLKQDENALQAKIEAYKRDVDNLPRLIFEKVKESEKEDWWGSVDKQTRMDRVHASIVDELSREIKNGKFQLQPQQSRRQVRKSNELEF